MSDKESGSSFIAGFIIGAIAGVAIGFLYAPKSGKETRAYLKEKASTPEKAFDRNICRLRADPPCDVPDTRFEDRWRGKRHDHGCVFGDFTVRFDEYSNQERDHLVIVDRANLEHRCVEGIVGHIAVGKDPPTEYRQGG